MYPTIEAGGRIHIAKYAEGIEVVKDTTRAILGDAILQQSKAIKLREADAGQENANKETVAHVHVHKHIATTPIGQPILKANSVIELLVIFADVIKCHDAIYKECKILHRDISINNILYYRTPDGVTGMLIDFGHSKDKEDDSTTRDMRISTPPFMSINNLENNDTPRTVLADWESLIYTICWIGTYGYNSETRRKCDSDKEYGATSNAAGAVKRGIG
ncbi:hypothetical protein FB645_002542 [Coemansia sp. IMI 203386]|nr:hypothetical protein FB645_002542 [Coemansia sp. IMI 203386]